MMDDQPDIPKSSPDLYRETPVRYLGNNQKSIS